MIDEKKLIERLENIQKNDCKSLMERIWFDGILAIVETQPKVGEQIPVDEQYPNEHTLEFKHFKLHADSTLKTYTKERLIRYIHMLYHNWAATDIWAARLLKVNDKLYKELEDVRKELPKNDY